MSTEPVKAKQDQDFLMPHVVLAPSLLAAYAYADQQGIARSRVIWPVQVADLPDGNFQVDVLQNARYNPNIEEISIELLLRLPNWNHITAGTREPT